MVWAPPQSKVLATPVNRMEPKVRYEIWKMLEWNGKEDNRPYFLTNSVLNLMHVIFRKIYTESDKQYFHRSIQHLLVVIRCLLIVVLRLCVLREERSYCIVVSTLQFVALML